MKKRAESGPDGGYRYGQEKRFRWSRRIRCTGRRCCRRCILSLQAEKAEDIDIEPEDDGDVEVEFFTTDADDADAKTEATGKDAEPKAEEPAKDAATKAAVDAATEVKQEAEEAEATATITEE